MLLLDGAVIARACGTNATVTDPDCEKWKTTGGVCGCDEDLCNAPENDANANATTAGTAKANAISNAISNALDANKKGDGNAAIKPGMMTASATILFAAVAKYIFA